MRKNTKAAISIGIVCVMLLSYILIFFSRIGRTEIKDGNTPLGIVTDDSFLTDMAKYELWESGEYSTTTGGKSAHRRRMRSPETIARNYVEYYIELSEEIRLMVFEYDREMNYLGYEVLSNGDVLCPGDEAVYFTLTLYRTYSEKSLSPGEWNKLFCSGLTVRMVHGEEALYSSVDSSYDAFRSDAYLMDFGFFALWEGGDYSESDGTCIENKRRLRYPGYVDKMHDSYLVELSENLLIRFFEYDESLQYLGCSVFSNGEYFIPKTETVWFTMSICHRTAEKSMSLGQWNAAFSNRLTIQISHGDTSVFDIKKNEVLCTSWGTLTDPGAMAYMLLDNQGDAFADCLWDNLILSGAYSLRGTDLDNGNLTLYFSSSEGNDANHGLSPEYPKASLNGYSGMSNVNILLKCGDVFKMEDTFEVGSNSIIAAYGEGRRPVLDYYRELPLTFTEVEGLDNVWVADLSGLSICNFAQSKSNCNIGQLLINGEVNWKRIVGSTKDTFNPATLSNAADDGWAADWNTNRLYMYTQGNPNYYYIQYAPPLHAVSINKASNVEFKGIEIVGSGMHGVSIKNAENVSISSCYIHHIGGSILTSAGVRYGNAVQLWDGGINISVTHNFADWIFDTCYTNQGSDSDCLEIDVVFEKNVGAHSFWGIEVWGDGFSQYPFYGIEYAHNIIYSMMDITNPTTPMYSSKSGKIIFADPDMTKEQYRSYRCGYTYHQMSSVNVSNSGVGEMPKIHNNVFWNTNRFLAIIANDRKEELFSCLYDNFFYGETEVAGPALFRYTVGGGTKNYLESPEGYIDSSNRISIWSGGEVGDNSEELNEMISLMWIISGIVSVEE